MYGEKNLGEAKKNKRLKDSFSMVKLNKCFLFQEAGMRIK